LKELCGYYRGTYLTRENLYENKELAELYGLDSLKHAVTRFIVLNIDAISDNVKFLDLSFD